MKTCETCKYTNESITQEPCYSCMVDTRNKRQPKDHITEDNKIVSTPMLKNESLYYLAHPLMTGGKIIDQNRREEKLIYHQILSRYPGIKILRPLELLPETMDNAFAMYKCYHLMAASDAIILSPGWEMSTGCRLEKQFCEDNDKDIFYFKDHDVVQDLLGVKK